MSNDVIPTLLMTGRTPWPLSVKVQLHDRPVDRATIDRSHRMQSGFHGVVELRIPVTAAALAQLELAGWKELKQAGWGSEEWKNRFRNEPESA